MYNILMQNYYHFIIPRLDGREIEKDFRYYLSLVKKGVAGFIVFGGELEQIREDIKRLQDEAELPLIIASDLEQGLGQQINGGTIFPPAMAMASAIKKNSKFKIQSSKLRLLKDAFKAFALEARYAGINTILAPVLDINTNPKNPIISVRAFGEESEAVSFFGCEMIKAIQSYGIATCGKHFPGHGDTEVDSHIKLPIINKDLSNLRKHELQPFKKAVEAEVKMIMLGHLNVPAIDSSGIPVSISEKAIRFLREEMKYKGILITDALNMGGIGKYSEEKAAFMALRAGVNIILHPTDPEKIVSYLKRKNIVFDADCLRRFRRGFSDISKEDPPDFGRHRRLSQELTERAIKISGRFQIKEKPFVVILNDDDPPPSSLPRGEGARERVKSEKGSVFIERLKRDLPGLRLQILKRDSRTHKLILPEGTFIIVAIFSETKAWKGGTGRWLYNKISSLEDKADLFVSFGSPYLLDDIKKNIAKIFAYWDSESAQKAAAKIITGKKSLNLGKI